MAAASTIPVVKAITGWNPAAIGIWSLLLVQCFALAVVVVKKGPEWIKAFSDSRKLDAETKSTLDEAVEKRLRDLEERAKKSETVSMYLTGATALLLNALRSVDADNPAISQANSLVEMAVAAGGESDFAKGLARLAMVPAAK